MTPVTGGCGTVVAVKRGMGFVGPLNKVKLGRSKIPAAGLEEQGRFVDVEEIRRLGCGVSKIEGAGFFFHISVEGRDLMKLMLSEVYSNTVASRGGN